MIYKWDLTIPQLSGDKTRKGYIYLPDFYDDEPERRYPVMYMFDGHNVFFDSDATYGKSWGMGSYMAWTRTPLIIVAIECNHEGDGRLIEYSPLDFENSTLGRIHGKGRIYMDWLTKELKPKVDARVRTMPDREHTIICGSSMGGLMALYGAVEYNDVFQRAACLSPSLWVSPSKVIQMIAKAQIKNDTCIYMDIDLLLKYRKEYQKTSSDGFKFSPQPFGKGGNDADKDLYDQFIVLVDETKNVQDVEKQIRALGYNTDSSMSYLTEMQEQSKFLRTILGAIGIIAFFVAALSITNTMIMSIYERTREIGVMKVLGCRVRDVRSMFLVEAGIIGLVGGIFGVFLSYGAAALLNYLGKDSGGILGYSTGGANISVIPPWLSLVALALACCVGIVSGLYPAIRATRLPALEALKNE